MPNPSTRTSELEASDDGRGIPRRGTDERVGETRWPSREACGRRGPWARWGVGFFDRFRRKPEGKAPVAPDRVTPRHREQVSAAHAATPLPPEVARLAKIGREGAPTEAEVLAILSSLRSSPLEGRALDVLFASTRGLILPDSVALAAGAMLVDRGERTLALRVLGPVLHPSGLLLRADLAAETGDVPTALACVEKVLLKDLDHPGARERHLRFRAELGLSGPQKAVSPGVTMVARQADAPFELLREIARGGAGAVYEAVDRELERRVALKVYHHPERDEDQLRHEARVASSLAGPGVVRVYDVDPEHGWIALSWAKMGAFREHVRAKDRTTLLPIERWLFPLTATLARVHAAGWVHHDVKPANVLLADLDTPVLTDFGIARRAGEPSPAGSLGYVSPERLAGRVSDPRDDVYGLGRMLEDVLEAVGSLAGAEAARFRPFASACTGPDIERPADARAFYTRLRVELRA